jgi:hypothetical protein
MFDYGALEDIDIVSFHPYAVSPEKSIKLYDRMVNILTGRGFKGEIWITEVGFPTQGWYPTRVSEKKYPDYIIKTLAGLASHGADKIIWYELFDYYDRDEKASRMDSEKYFGLIYHDLSYKAGAYAFALFGKYIPGAVYIPDYSKAAAFPASVESFYFQREDHNTLILWKKGLGSVKTRLSFSGTNHLMHDISSGDSIVIQNEIDISLNSTPQFYTWENR